MEQIVMLDPRILKEHPRNTEFFDDVDGAEFTRLVESIKLHGVLTPLRVTEGMTIISGHQRKRAAIEAECYSVPAIIDSTKADDEVLMKLIETNFGRLKNDPIKQAKWVKEYEKLRGVRQGSAESNNFTQRDVTEDDIAKELGVSRQSLQNLKSLLKLEPALQTLISDGKINATTGFKLLAKLTPAEQQSLLDALPDDVKFSAKTIESYINKIRSEAASNAAAIQQSADGLRGQIDELKRENNALKDGYVIPEDAQEQIDKLQLDSRKYYESWQSSKKRVDQLEDLLEKAMKAKATAEAAAKGGDEGITSLQNQLDEMEKELEAERRKANDFESQLSEKVDEIKDLERRAKDGFMRTAITPAAGSEEANERQIRQLMDTIQTTIGTFIEGVNKVMMQANLIPSIPDHILGALCHTSEDAETHAHRLWNELMKNVSPDSYINQGDDGDDDYFDDDEIEHEDIDYDKYKKSEFTMEELGLDY